MATQSVVKARAPVTAKKRDGFDGVIATAIAKAIVKVVAKDIAKESA